MHTYWTYIMALKSTQKTLFNNQLIQSISKIIFKILEHNKSHKNIFVIKILFFLSWV